VSARAVVCAVARPTPGAGPLRASARGSRELGACARELGGGLRELGAGGMQLAFGAGGAPLCLLEAGIRPRGRAVVSAGDLATDEAGEQRQGEGGERDQGADAGGVRGACACLDEPLGDGEPELLERDAGGAPEAFEGVGGGVEHDP